MELFFLSVAATLFIAGQVYYLWISVINISIFSYALGLTFLGEGENNSCTYVVENRSEREPEGLAALQVLVAKDTFFGENKRLKIIKNVKNRKLGKY